MPDIDPKLEALRKEIMIGVEQYHRGEYTSINSEEELDQFFKNLHAEIDAELVLEKNTES